MNLATNPLSQLKNIASLRFLAVALFGTFLSASDIWLSAVQAEEVLSKKVQDRKVSVEVKRPAPNVEWAQWGGDSRRNNTPVGYNIPTDWDIGTFDYKTGAWDKSSSRNIKWVARLGSQSYGNPVVADGRIFVGTNNMAEHLKRFPKKQDLGCLISFDLETGAFLWQHSSRKLKTGRVHDWPDQGICSAPLVEGKRLWFVTSRGEVRCLDTEGFYDNENDGPYKDEEVTAKNEADVIWVYDMMKTLGVSQHNMANCSVTSAGDVLFVHTSNGLDESHKNLPAPNAPSFIALDKNSGKLLWQDKSPATNILHGQWSSPAYGLLKGVPQAIFCGGDGWVYSFDPKGDGHGNSKLLWKFDTNPKNSKWVLGGTGTRNNIIATPVLWQDKVYVAVGQDPEHEDGLGHLWCIDPSKRGDVSPEIAYNSSDPTKPILHKRIQATVPEEGDFSRANSNSAVLWHYSKYDANGDGEIEYAETMHRSIGTVAIKDGILYIADFSGLFHCLDANTGKVHWVYDMMSASWGSPLIVEGKVYLGDEGGEISIFKHSSDPKVAMRIEEDEPYPAFGKVEMGSSVYSTPIVAGNILYIADRTHLFAIEVAEENK